MDQNQTRSSAPHLISRLYRHVSGNCPNSQPEMDNLYLSDVQTFSPTFKTKHFTPFFHGKVMNNEDKSKRSASLDSKLNALFDKYKNTEEEDMILMDGVERLCSDLGLLPDDFKILLLAWKFNAEQMCQFSRKEMVNGCKALNVENLSQIRNRLNELVVQLRSNPELFKNLYRFTFKFGLDQASGQRILPIDVALCLWKLVFSLHKPPILDRWLFFLQKDQAQIRSIPRDTWNMFLNFSETVGDDLSSYDDAEAWPSIFDNFVEYENDRVNENVITASEKFDITRKDDITLA